MDKQRKVFKDGAVEHGVKPAVAEKIFALMEKFAGYGFNKSHSVAYALIAYHTAWLKAHHPAAFMAATLSSELEKTDKVVLLLDDCRKLELEVHPPNVNACYHGFRPLDEHTILYGVGAVKGVGKLVSEGIETEREQNGKFADLFDFCRRLDSRIFTKRVLEALIKCGAMDDFGDRAALVEDVPNAMQAAEQLHTSQTTGQSDMFGEVKAPAARPSARQVPAWSDQQRLAAEKDTLGLYLSGHPYKRFEKELEKVTEKLSASDSALPVSGIFAGLVMSLRAINTRRGKMAFTMLENSDGVRVEVILYSDQFQRYRALLQKDEVLIAHGDFSTDEMTDGIQLRAEAVADVDTFRNKYLRRIRLTLTEQTAADTLPKIRHLLHPHRNGSTNITIHYRRTKGESGTIHLGTDWSINPTRAVIEGLNELTDGGVRFEYDVAGFRASGTKNVQYGQRMAAAG